MSEPRWEPEINTSPVFEPVPTGACGIERKMICTCGEEGERAAVALRLEVQRRLGVTRSAEAWTAAVLSLAWEFGCDLFVMADMWFGVSARASDGTRAYIECDWPFDGVFALWKEAADRSPERLTRRVEADVSDTQERADALLAEYVTAHNTSRAHDYACPSCAAQHVDRVAITPMPKRCAEGKALWDAYFPPLRALTDLWAIPAPEDAPSMWGERDCSDGEDDDGPEDPNG